MKISISDLERTYSSMSNEDFERISWADLSDQARPVYARELQRRNLTQWQAVLAREAERESLAAAPLKESLFGTQGRLPRGTYALRLLTLNATIMIAAYCLGLIIGSTFEPNVIEQIIPVIALVIGGLGELLIAIQAIKRLHDLNRPGTHFWLLLLPGYGLYLAVLLLAKQGTRGSNSYGEDPLAGEQLTRPLAV
jgi:uncharacterized membrane protein YhaH (DUF805 family)